MGAGLLLGSAQRALAPQAAALASFPKGPRSTRQMVGSLQSYSRASSAIVSRGRVALTDQVACGHPFLTILGLHLDSSHVTPSRSGRRMHFTTWFVIWTGVSYGAIRLVEDWWGANSPWTKRVGQSGQPADHAQRFTRRRRPRLLERAGE